MVQLSHQFDPGNGLVYNLVAVIRAKEKPAGGASVTALNVTAVTAHRGCGVRRQTTFAVVGQAATVKEASAALGKHQFC
jgi:hypothetical protein